MVMILDKVAPYTGAWIEIGTRIHIVGFCAVAPYTGAWIEIQKYGADSLETARRSLHGSVD